MINKDNLKPKNYFILEQNYFICFKKIITVNLILFVY